MYSASKSWDQIYSSNNEISYPAEGVIRIFKGTAPDLAMPRETGNSILDVGAGDGRHIPFLTGLGYEVSATEITDSICDVLNLRMQSLSVHSCIKKGHAGKLPFNDSTFDRLLTWNSCYYMSHAGLDFTAHVVEMARVICPGGWIIASIPKKTSFIFKNSVPASNVGYRTINDDYFDGSRNGEIMRCFEDRVDLVSTFSPNFTDFCHADIDMSWFGLDYHWHVFCARKK